MIPGSGSPAGVGLPSGTAPEELGERTQLADHILVAVEGHIPANDVVWECDFCAERGTTTGEFYSFDCDRSDSE